jgi:phenylacetic acid degradation operon negative regulatory protein
VSRAPGGPPGRDESGRIGPVTPDQTPPPAAGPQQSRTALVSFLGSIVRPLGNWLPIAGTIELMGQFGLDAPSVRTAVFRLKKRGWLASETRSGSRGYALAPIALKALADGDEIIWHARQPADLADGWCIVSFSVPESARSKRDQLRTHLAALGFGNVGAAMWIAPARMRAAADQAIAELGLTAHCAIFVGDYVGGRDLPGLLRDSWDLVEIDRRYREFSQRFQGEAPKLDAIVVDRRRAFLSYLAIIDQWRKLPFRDPGLPREILPADWSAPAAGALFEGLVAALEAPALAHAAAHWPGTGKPTPPADNAPAS